MALGRTPFNFSTLADEERHLIEAVVSGKSDLEETSLKVVRVLERTLTILLDISMMSDESFYHHLALTGQIAFNVRNSPIFLIWFYDYHFNIYPWQTSMMCTHWVVERGHVREVVAMNRANQATFK